MFVNSNQKTDMMIDNMVISNIRIFIFGTLRKGCNFEYYMEGSSPLGLYYTRGQLMESTVGSAYINFDVPTGRTIGELHHVNYYCLQRINHLENTSGEFPKGYDLDLLPVWAYKPDEEQLFREDEKILAFFYKRRGSTPMAVPGGDWLNRKSTLAEIERLLKNETSHTMYHTDIINHIIDYLKQ